MFFSNDLPDSLVNILQGIVPSIPEFITALISLAILLIVVTWLMYKPIKKSIEDRKKYIHSNIANSQDRLLEAEKRNEDSKKELNESKDMGKKIVATSIREANEKSNKILIDARDKSHQIIDSAKNQAISEINLNREKIKHEAVDIAIELSEKLVHEKITSKKDKEIIDQFIKELEEDAIKK